MGKTFRNNLEEDFYSTQTRVANRQSRKKFRQMTEDNFDRSMEPVKATKDAGRARSSDPR